MQENRWQINFLLFRWHFLAVIIFGWFFILFVLSPFDDDHESDYCYNETEHSNDWKNHNTLWIFLWWFFFQFFLFMSYSKLCYLSLKTRKFKVIWRSNFYFAFRVSRSWTVQETIRTAKSAQNPRNPVLQSTWNHSNQSLCLS